MRLIRLIALIMLSMPVTLMAGEMDEAKFEAWMGGLSIDGLKFYQTEKDGETINAMFINPGSPETGGRMISMAPIEGFADYQKTVDNPKMRMGPTEGFIFNGFRTVLVDTQSEIGQMVAVEAKNINKTIVVSFPPKTSKALIEATLVKTGLYQK